MLQLSANEDDKDLSVPRYVAFLKYRIRNLDYITEA